MSVPILSPTGVWAYGGVGPGGKSHTAGDVRSMTRRNFYGKFATVVVAAEMLARVRKVESLEHV